MSIDSAKLCKLIELSQQNALQNNVIISLLEKVLDAMNTNIAILNDNPIPMPEVCAILTDGTHAVVTPVNIIRDGQVVQTIYIDSHNKVVDVKTLTSSCDCPCSDCPDVKVCQTCYFGDVEALSNWDANATANFKVLVNDIGVAGTSTIVHNVDNGLKSSWYKDVSDAVNQYGQGWTMTLQNDAKSSDGSTKPTYQIAYTGQGPSKLTIVEGKPGGWDDFYVMSVDAMGNVTTASYANDPGNPFGSPAFKGACA